MRPNPIQRHDRDAPVDPRMRGGWTWRMALVLATTGIVVALVASALLAHGG